MTMRWTSDLEIGVPVIDSQHQRIVDYINQVHVAHLHHSREELMEVLDGLVDYTISHFAFEETLMEEAGYAFIKAHKKVHVLFCRRIEEYCNKAKAGQDVTDELLHTLQTWLINHIKHDDRDYSPVVKANMREATKRAKMKKGSWMSRLFG